MLVRLEQFTKGWKKRLEELEIKGRIETIPTTAFLRSTRILRKVLETWGDLLSLRYQWTITSLPWREKLTRINLIITLPFVFCFFSKHWIMGRKMTSLSRYDAYILFYCEWISTYSIAQSAGGGVVEYTYCFSAEG